MYKKINDIDKKFEFFADYNDYEGENDKIDLDKEDIVKNSN